LFKWNYGDEGFYSGDEADMTDGEHSEAVGTKEGNLKIFIGENLKPQKLCKPSK
jgi:hypothetical protein